ncbi:MAG: EipB family protein, partial [Bradyrhizobium sp.]
MARRFRYSLTRSMLLVIAAVALASGSAGQAAMAASASFLPHQALYDLTLVKSRGSVSIDTARGRILYTFSGSDCEG